MYRPQTHVDDKYKKKKQQQPHNQDKCELVFMRSDRLFSHALKVGTGVYMCDVRGG